MEVLSCISFLLGASWDFFTEINVPGFDFSFAAFFVGLFLVSLSLRFLFSMLGMGISSQSFTSVFSKPKLEDSEELMVR